MAIVFVQKVTYISEAELYTPSNYFTGPSSFVFYLPGVGTHVSYNRIRSILGRSYRWIMQPLLWHSGWNDRFDSRHLGRRGPNSLCPYTSC
jgi:hypothetical protein